MAEKRGFLFLHNRKGALCKQQIRNAYELNAPKLGAMRVELHKRAFARFYFVFFHLVAK